VWRQLTDRDPLLYMQLVDTTNNQIVILLFITSNPEAPRFSVDRDWGGEPTKFGTLSRNVEAEVAAMQAGLSPGQVRQGLRMARKMMPNFECFIARLGHELFLMEPLAYQSAILFESFGCAYSQGRRRMERIHQGFQPGGEYFVRLDGSTPFRRPGAEKTVRGRSWAIHDGILGEPYTDYHMYKHVGKQADVCTFPKYVW
jgi:acetoin utilization protein AcuC